MRTGIVAAEIPAIDYGAMSPMVHRDVERILSQRGGASMRMDGIEIDNLEVIRGIFRANQGDRLPVYRHDESGEYIQMGQTAPIEERHTRIMAIERDGREDDNLWVELPIRTARSSNPEPPETMNPAAFREALNTVRTDLKLGALCLVADGVGFYGLQTGKLGTTAANLFLGAGIVGAATVSIDAARRLFPSRHTA